jgi:hypothetical protein
MHRLIRRQMTSPLQVAQVRDRMIRLADAQNPTIEQPVWCELPA